VRDLLLERGVPHDLEELDADAAERRGRHQHRHRRRDREQEADRRAEEDREVPREQQAGRPPAQHDEAADHAAGCVAREDQPPGGGAAKMVVRDHGPEHEVRPAREAVDEHELDDDRPEPRARGELAPADAQLMEEARRGVARRCRHPYLHHECGADEERRGVECQRPARADAADHESREAGADDRCRAIRQPQEGVRLLEPAGADDARDQAGRGREEERVRDAADELQDDELPELRAAADQERRDRPLSHEHDEVGRHHDEVARRAVGPDAADEDEEDLGDPDRGEHDAQVRRRAVQVVEDCECERDRSERAAEERYGAAEEEEAELALAERAEAAQAARSRRFSAQRRMPRYECQNGMAWAYEAR